MSTSKRQKSAPAKAKPKLKPVTGVKSSKHVAAAGDFAPIVARAQGKRLVLHIGCGSPNPEKLHPTFRGPEWHEVRLDIDVNAKPDIIADMIDMRMVPDASVDAVWSSHNMEHLYPHQVPIALKEIFRIIKPEGFFLVTMPDIQTVASYVAHGMLADPLYDSPAGPITPIDIMYGLRSAIARGNTFMAHRTAFTAKTLGEEMRDAGFTNILVRREWVDLWAVGHKYPLGHPKRVERTVIEGLSDEDQKKVKMPAPLPLNRTPHPGLIRGKHNTDELDIPPKVWEPVSIS